MLASETSGSIEALYDCIIEARRESALQLLRGESASRGFPETLRLILEPALRLVGDRWRTNEISLAQGYVAGKVAEDFLEIIVASQGRPNQRCRACAVIGNAEDDYHGLGRRMVGTFLRLDGWEVHDLGNDVEARAFVDAAQNVGAAVIGVSAMMLSTARNILKIRDELERRSLARAIRLAAGGAVFAMRPSLAEELGADGTAATAMEAAALFNRLAGLASPGRLSIGAEAARGGS